MKPVYAPNYYKDFRCIASACQHTCCVGWEIDVDAETLAYYDTVEGGMGARLRENIDREADPPCFRLDSQERCPFLNPNGLCDLITELGEDSLCHICADHPRFRNCLYDRVELGLGLTCEAAARLILEQEAPMEIIRLCDEQAASERAAREEPDEPDPITDALLETREVLLSLLQDRTTPLSDRIRHILASLDIDLSMTASPILESYSALSDTLRDMERLDPAWDTCLTALSTLPGSPVNELDGENATAYEQLTAYFLYRYLTAEDDGRPDLIPVRVLFALLSVITIHAIHRAMGGEDGLPLWEVARMYSSEIEYSEENTQRLMDEAEDAVF